MNNNGFYRGLVVDNVDSTNKGMCKIYVPGLYPPDSLKTTDMLPWSEPAMPLFGGSGASADGARFISNGWTSSPTIGSYVWLFFDGGDQNYPKHFAASQAGDAWMSEHEMQHVLSTDNFRIVVDENPSNSVSSMKADTVNDECTAISRGNVKTDQNVRARIEIESDQIGLDIVIKGDVNLFIDGDQYVKITGDRHTTIDGDDFLKVVGNTQEEHGGDLDSSRDGDSYKKINGKEAKDILKDQSTNVVGERKTFAGGNNVLDVGGSNMHTAGGIHGHV